MHTPENLQSPTVQAIEIAVRLGLIFLILALCFQILSPFISIIAWGAIIAVAIYRPFFKLVGKLGGRKKLALAFIAVFGLAIVLVPVFFLSSSVVESATTLGHQFSAGEIAIPAPPDSVEEWPIVGEQTHELWLQASQNMEELLKQYPHQLSVVSTKLLSAAAGVGGGILQFIVSTLIAMAFLSSADSIRLGMQRLARRLNATLGEELLDMSVSTIRSVAVGVIGIAFIQAVLGGIGMMLAGVPAAGLFAVAILILAIAQLPPLLVLAPVAFYIFSAESTTVAVIFLIWSILVSSSDMVLKPLLLGRGIDVPMLVILLGAIGGMLTSGIVGLFIGAVVLALGYKLVAAWLQWTSPVDEEPIETGD